MKGKGSEGLGNLLRAVWKMTLVEWGDILKSRGQGKKNGRVD